MSAATRADAASSSPDAAAASSPAVDRVALADAFLRASCANGRFDQAALSQLCDIRVEAGRVRCALPVTRAVQNRYGTLHGGCIATVIDVVTTAALVSVSPFSGVTLELSTSYLNPAQDGDVADVEATVLKAGGAVAVLACTVTARATRRRVAEGRHTKYLPRTEVAPQLARMQAEAAARSEQPHAGDATAMRARL